MATTQDQAVNEMYGAVKDVLAASFASVVRKYDGIDTHEPPDPQTWWTYSVIRHALTQQASLMGDSNKRRWNEQGTLITQIFVPMTDTGRVGAVNVAKVLVSGIQKLCTPGGVWFRNTGFKEIGKSEGWFQVNFTTSFSYDRIE